jgi:aquaporin Z
MGTFMLVFVAAGSAIVSELTDRDLSLFSRGFLPGLLILGMIYSVGVISGAHFNPGVSLSFFLRGVFPLPMMLVYWVCQFAGAIAAAAYLRLLFDNRFDLGTNRPRDYWANEASLYGMETILSFHLYFVILCTANGNRLVGHNTGLAVGLTIAMLGILGEPLGIGSMNVARSLGPAFVSGSLEDQWIFVAGSFTGACLANLAVFLIYGPPSSHEGKAACGDSLPSPGK